MKITIYLNGILLFILFFSAIKDWKEHRIPNVYLVRGAAIRVLILLCETKIHGIEAVKSLGIKIGISVLILIIGLLIRRVTQDGIGMGDIKLCALMFVYLAPIVWFNAIFISLFLGMIHAFIETLYKRRKARIPFAPSLFLGTLATILLH